MTRYASRPLRLWAAAQQQRQAAAQQAKKGSGGGGGGSVSKGAVPAGRLRIADGGLELTVEPAKALA